jgi:hypothetical protein
MKDIRLVQQALGADGGSEIRELVVRLLSAARKLRNRAPPVAPSPAASAWSVCLST